MKQRFANKNDLLIELVRTNFKLRYNNSFLGFLWVLLKPFCMFLVLFFIFSYFRGGWIENYQVYLLLGIILYTFFNEGVVFGMNSILGTAHIILKVNFPREIALTSSVVMAVVNLTINLLILGVFILFNPLHVTLLSIIYFVGVLLVLFLLVYGISFFSSIVLVKLRDLEHITTLIMQLLFYATPIFYPVTILPESVRKVVLLNPLTVIVQAARSALIYGKIEKLPEMGIVLGVSVVLLILGHRYFKRNVKRIAELF